MSIKAVFLSSTARDLAEYREAVYRAIEGLDGCHCVRMEDFGARDWAADDFCRAKVAECDHFVGIVGHCYGSCPSGSEQSYTEREYEAAIVAELPRLMFIAPKDFPLPAHLIEPDREREKQQAFRDQVSTEGIRDTFTTPENLARRVVQAIRNWEQEQIQQEKILASQRPARTEIGQAVHILPSVDTSHFTGRGQGLSALENLILRRSDSDRAVVGLWGGPGVGKSALARHFAITHVEQFPDGIIGLDSQNKDADRLAVNFAAFIGEPVDPESELEPSAIMQSRFARRQALLILDNANRSDIRELIPGGRCAVIVTTRDRDLLDHIGLPSEAQIRLHRFKRDESLAFLTRLVGEEAVREEQSAARKLASLVAGLPLALRIAGEVLRSQFLRSDPFARYVADLRNEKSRLSQLQWRDADELNVTAVFQRSLALLRPEERQTSACLAVCVESGFGLAAAAAAAGLSEDTAALHLSRLVNLALLNFDPDSGRFRFHPLLHLFARHEAEELGIWSQAEERHATYFTNYVSGRQALTGQSLSDLEIEQDAILHTAREKIERKDLDVPFWHGLRHLLEHRGHWQTGIELMRGYLALAEHTREDLTAAHFHLQLGKYALLLGQFDGAIAAFQRSLDILEELGDRRGIAMVLNSLGGALRAKGQFDDAIAAFQRSLDILEELGDRRGIAMVLNSLGRALQAKGQFDDAIAAFQRSLDILEELGDRRGIAMVLNSLGGALQAKGQFDDAIAAFQRSLDILEELGDRRGIAMVLNSLGGALLARGQFDDAIAAFQRSLDILEELGDRRGIAMARQGLVGHSTRL